MLSSKVQFSLLVFSKVIARFTAAISNNFIGNLVLNSTYTYIVKYLSTYQSKIKTFSILIGAYKNSLWKSKEKCSLKYYAQLWYIIVIVIVTVFLYLYS